MAQSWYDLTFKDWSDESSVVQVFVSPLTALDITAELIGIAALRDSIKAICSGVAWKDRVVNGAQILDGTLPTTPLAQRENKWLVRYHGDDSGKKYSLEIPTAALVTSGGDSRLVPGSDFADLTQTEIAAFVGLFHTWARNPDSGTETNTVDSIQFVGRDL